MMRCLVVGLQIAGNAKLQPSGVLVGFHLMRRKTKARFSPGIDVGGRKVTPGVGMRLHIRSNLPLYVH